MCAWIGPATHRQPARRKPSRWLWRNCWPRAGAREARAQQAAAAHVAAREEHAREAQSQNAAEAQAHAARGEARAREAQAREEPALEEQAHHSQARQAAEEQARACAAQAFGAVRAQASGERVCMARAEEQVHEVQAEAQARTAKVPQAAQEVRGTPARDAQAREARASEGMQAPDPETHARQTHEPTLTQQEHPHYGEGSHATDGLAALGGRVAGRGAPGALAGARGCCPVLGGRADSGGVESSAKAPETRSPGDWCDLNFRIARSLQRRQGSDLVPPNLAWAFPSWRPPRGGPCALFPQEGQQTKVDHAAQSAGAGRGRRQRMRGRHRRGCGWTSGWRSSAYRVRSAAGGGQRRAGRG